MSADEPAPATGDPGAGTDKADASLDRIRHQGAFEFSQDSQVITDQSGVILEANHAAAALLHCSKEFLIGKPLAFFGAEEHRSRFYRTIAALSHGSSGDDFGARVGRGERPRDVVVMVRSGGGDGGATRGRRFHWFFRDVTELKRSEAAQRELLRLLTTAEEDERRRASRDLHDTVGQTLTALALSVNAIRLAGPLPPAALAHLNTIQQLTDDLGRQAHELATRLRPTALDDLGLVAAVRQLVLDWSGRTGVATDFTTTEAGAVRFPSEIETALYRVIQEALTNVARHAGARKVGVILGRTDGHAIAIVEDDGAGLGPAAPALHSDTRPTRPTRPTRLGLLGMRERVTLLGGTLELESNPGHGTTVIARIPV